MFFDVLVAVRALSQTTATGSENVTLKMNSLFFKLFRVYISSLEMSKVAEFPWSLFLGEPHSSLERERKSRRRLFTSSIIRPFIRGKIRRVLNKTRTARINGSRLISVLDSFSCECCP